MPPKRYAANDPREWLNRSKGNLARCALQRDDFYLEDLCFDAQQAAEKALKAVLLARGITFPYTHDLDTLSTLIEGAGVSMPPEVREADLLTRFAVAARYPGAIEPLTQEIYKAAIELAESVVRWAESTIEGIGQTNS